MGRIGKAGSCGLRATLMALALLPALAQPQNASPMTLVPETPAALPPAASTTALPLIWRPAALGDWTVWRKTHHTTAVAILLALAVLVTVRGGLCFP